MVGLTKEPGLIDSLFSNIKTFCGGAIISDQYILTAAHCTISLRAENIRIILGAHDVRKSKPISIDRVYHHPEYNDMLHFNDIALIKLARPIEFNNEISPICLPSADLVKFNNLVISGWGHLGNDLPQSKTLQEVDLKEVDENKCKFSYGPRFRSASNICAANSDNKGVCHGDSGGPLMSIIDGTNNLVGLVSYGTKQKCGNANHPAVFTRITNYLSWILKETKNSKFCQN